MVTPGRASRSAKTGAAWRSAGAGDAPGFARPRNAWLDLGSSLGHFGTFLLMAYHFLLLLAPVFWMVNFHSLVPAQGRTTLEEVILILSGPELLIHMANLIALPGVITLAAAFLAVAAGLRSQKAPVRGEIVAMGVLSASLLLLWVPLRLYSAKTGGSTLTLDAVAATGGLTVASLILLVSALLWMGFTLGVGRDIRVPRITCYHWPVYAAVNVLGATAVAAFFQTMAAGAPSQDVYTLGMVLKVTLVPVLGVLAYAVLRDKLRMMRRLPTPRFAAVRPSGRLRGALPTPFAGEPPSARTASPEPKP